MTNLEKWQFYLKDIESPELYIEWGFYHLISSALQRRVWLYSDGDTMLPGSYSLFPNLYVVLVGPPATGKGRVIAQEASIIKSPILMRADEKGELKPSIPCSPDKVTLEMLIKVMCENPKPITREVEIKGKKAIQTYSTHPCAFLIEELEVLFAANTNDTVATLCHCYDSHGLDYRTKHNGEFKMEAVCVSMMSGTTPDSIRDLMQSKIIKKGLTSRSVFVFGDAPRFYRQFPGVNEEQRKACKELTDYVKKLTGIFTEVKLSPEAQAFHKDYYESGNLCVKRRVNKDPRLDHYYGRKNIQWLKLAMVMHFAEQTESNIIQVESLERALTALANVEIRMHEAFMASGRNELYDSAIEIERYVQEKGKQSYKALWWVFSRDLQKIQFDECIDLLTTTGRMISNNGILMSTGKS